MGMTRTVLWQRLDEPGFEYCMLQPQERGWLLQGDAITEIDGKPARLVYQVRVDAAWRSHRVAVDALVGARRYRLHVVQHARRGWRTRPDNTPLPHLQGCVDVDLGISPVTNTLPIRRLAPQIGQSVDVTTAWIRFPSGGYEALTIDPLAQRYTRLDERRYHYQSGPVGSPFTYESDIEVDEMGLVITYEGGWVRQAEYTG